MKNAKIKSFVHNHKPYAAFKSRPVVRNYLPLLLLYVFVTAGAFISIGFFPVDSREQQFANGMAVVLLFLPIVYLFISDSRSRSKKGPKPMPTKNFVELAKWKDSDGLKLADLPIRYLNYGLDKNVLLEYSGRYSGRKFKGVKFDYLKSETDYLDNKRERVRWDATCIRFELGKLQIPFIEIQRKYSWSILDKKVSFAKYSQKLEVEGDFHKNFDTSIIKGTNTVVLTFFTPDLMSELQDSPYDFNFEISGDFLYLYSQGGDSGTIHNLLGGADIIFSHIDQLKDSWDKASTAKEIREIRQSIILQREKELKRQHAYDPEGYLIG